MKRGRTRRWRKGDFSWRGRELKRMEGEGKILMSEVQRREKALRE